MLFLITAPLPAWMPAPKPPMAEPPQQVGGRQSVHTVPSNPWIVNPSIVAPGEPVEIHVRTEDAFYNRAEGGIPDYEVRLNGELVDRLVRGKAIQRLETTFEEPGVYRYTFRSTGGGVEGERRGELVVGGEAEGGLEGVAVREGVVAEGGAGDR